MFTHSDLTSAVAAQRIVEGRERAARLRIIVPAVRERLRAIIKSLARVSHGPAHGFTGAGFAAEPATAILARHR